MMNSARESSTSKGFGGFFARLPEFFGGRVYPIIIVSLALFGHALGIEVLTNLFCCLLTSAALVLSSSSRPLIPYAMCVIFQISRINGPGVPNESDHYLGAWQLPLIILSFALLAVAIVYFVIKNRLWTRAKGSDLRFLLPLLVFSAVLLLNGVFSDEWTPGSLGYGALMAFLLVLLFLLFYYGLMTEDKGEITSYFSYTSALVVILLFLEIVIVYLFGGAIVDGEFVKENIVFGWGVWNSMGVALAMLIPAVFIGVIRSRYSPLYFGASALALAAIFLTLSRGAWLFGLVTFLASVIFAAFWSSNKRFYRVLLGVGALCAVVAAVLLFDKIPDILRTLFNDNGRFLLYRIGIEEFLSSPVFGTGFFGFDLPDDPLYFKGASFIPAFAHCTPVELLSAMGIVGLIAYLAYRISTACELIKRFSVNNCLLFMTAAVMLMMSLVDNFFFQLWPTLTYSLALAIMQLPESESRTN